MSTVAISTPFNISLDFEIAEFHKRLIAYFIDLLVQVVYIIAVYYTVPLLFYFIDFISDPLNKSALKIVIKILLVLTNSIILIGMIFKIRKNYIKRSNNSRMLILTFFQIALSLWMAFLMIHPTDVEDMTDFSGLYIFFVGIPILLYHLLMEVFNNGQSLGKMALGIRVMSLEGGEPHLGQYMIRWIFRVFEWLPMLLVFTGWNKYNFILQAFLTGVFGLIVVLTVAVSKKNQRFGDMAAGTTVVNTRIKLGLSDTVFQEVTVKDYKVTFPDVMRLSDRDINAIKAVLKQSHKTGRFDTAHRVAFKVKEVLKIASDLEVTDFLQKLLEDYNYLAIKE